MSILDKMLIRWSVMLQLFTAALLMLNGADARNVLMMVADDVGREMKVYGNTAIKMPNMDNLAHRSVAFTSNFNSVSSCSPSRSAILTGLPTHQNGMFGLHHGYHHFSSFDTVQSLPKIASDNGVRTGIIGKKHVGPNAVYPFDFDHSEDTENLLQASRNITYIRQLVHEFLHSNDTRPFFLYIGFMDAHRCSGKYGEFCEKFGNGDPEMGIIPDWHPTKYDPSEVYVPYFIQDTPTARDDLANQYLSLSRLDQGIGLVLAELASSGHVNDTLVIYTSDNGIPFPSAKTNLYDPGQVEPLLISSPEHTSSWGGTTSVLSSLLDLTPTVLDWFQIPYPDYYIFQENERAILTGKSLVNYLNTSNINSNGATVNKSLTEDMAVFASHQEHEITMYYPMRTVRTSQYKLIHNLNFKAPYPIATDLYSCPTFQDILNRTQEGSPLPWYKTLQHYYYRDQWELFDLKVDPEERYNVANKSQYLDVMTELKTMLWNWQNTTYDPWICSPSGVLQDAGEYAINHQCFPLYNGLEMDN